MLRGWTTIKGTSSKPAGGISFRQGGGSDWEKKIKYKTINMIIIETKIPYVVQWDQLKNRSHCIIKIHVN